MKNPFSFFWNRSNERVFEMQSNMALNQQTAEAQEQADPYESVKQAERERMMLSDPTLSQFFARHPEFDAFIPALSPVNRTTKHISKSDAKVMWLNFQILFCMEEMCMSPDLYEAGAMEIIQGLEIYADTQISDGYEGWKGNILTQQRKTSVIATQLGKSK
jgi:hypothetical protein